ncbi:MAG: hypothetical protein LUD78_03790 [Clostridiales bacterium]|nr:hypothetical protein [Clostridiales bacterium]
MSCFDSIFGVNQRLLNFKGYMLQSGKLADFALFIQFFFHIGVFLALLFQNTHF